MDPITIDDFKKVDLRVGLVKQVEVHPNADKLYILTVEIGGSLKTLVAGVRAHYKPEELLNKKVVVVANMKPTIIRGVESNGMILVAKGPEGGLAILSVEKDMETGSSIS